MKATLYPDFSRNILYIVPTVWLTGIKKNLHTLQINTIYVLRERACVRYETVSIEKKNKQLENCDTEMRRRTRTGLGPSEIELTSNSSNCVQ